MDSIFEALVSGLAMNQAAQGAQEEPFMAGQRLSSCTIAVSPQDREPSPRHGLRVNCSPPPNTSKVGPPPTEEQIDLSTCVRGGFLFPAARPLDC